MNEFDLIQRYFGSLPLLRKDSVLGIGDDAAILQPPAGHELIMTTDTLVSGVHFSADTDPQALGHKALAVSLSDLAAMGAAPAWALLTLTLPVIDEPWLEAFARGWTQLANQYNLDLVGGDTTQGPLSITVQLTGHCPKGKALRRDGAKPGDLIYVTGTLGDAGLALLSLQDEVRSLSVAEKTEVLDRLQQPSPRVELGLQLRALASACIDISDGLAADLGHLLHASGTSATLYAAQLPITATVRRHIDECGGWVLPLTAGDDYELCFTLPESQQAKAEQVLAHSDVRVSWIGTVEAGSGVRCLDEEGFDIATSSGGYQHFR